MSRVDIGRIADALERLSPPPAHLPDFGAGDVFAWKTFPDRLVPVSKVNRVDLSLLVGIDSAMDALLANTIGFARGRLSNNALLWGARGMGKSSLVKAVHAHSAERFPDLKLVELQREDIGSLPALLAMGSGSAGQVHSFLRRFFLFL